MTTKQRSGTPRGIGAADAAIIRAVERLDYVTVSQVCRLLYRAGSLTYVRERLARLAAAGFLYRSGIPKATPAGSTPRVYTMGPQGRQYLAQHGATVAARLRLAEVEIMSGSHLEHALGITDFLVACELLCRVRPEYRISRALTDRDLKRAAFRVSLPGAAGKRSGVAPDAWVDFRRRLPDGRAVQRCLALEYDRASEHQPAWRLKVARLLAWARGPYSEYFGTRSLTIAVITWGGPARCEQLLHWTEAEITLHADPALGRYFLVTDQLPEQHEPAAFFLAPLWRRPYGGDPVGLLGTAADHQ